MLIIDKFPSVDFTSFDEISLQEIREKLMSFEKTVSPLINARSFHDDGNVEETDQRYLCCFVWGCGFQDAVSKSFDNMIDEDYNSNLEDFGVYYWVYLNLGFPPLGNKDVYRKIKQTFGYASNLEFEKVFFEYRVEWCKRMVVDIDKLLNNLTK